MPNITVQSLAEQMVVDQGGTTIDPTDVALFVTWVSDVCQAIATAADWLFFRTVETIAITASTATYSLSAIDSEVTVIRIASLKHTLRATSKEFLLSRRMDLDLLGLPIRFFNAGFDAATGKKQITFWPIPDTDLSVEVTAEKIIGVLAATDIIPYPDKFIPLIKDGVRIKNLEHEREFESADRVTRRFATDLDKMIERYTREPSRLLRRREADITREDPWLQKPLFDPSRYYNP